GSLLAGWIKPTLRAAIVIHSHGGGKSMVLSDDETERVLQEEGPGPPDLESALSDETLSGAISHPPLVMDAKASLVEVLRYMREADRGAVLGVSDGKLVGIFTERAVLLRVAGNAIDLE